MKNYVILKKENDGAWESTGALMINKVEKIRYVGINKKDMPLTQKIKYFFLRFIQEIPERDMVYMFGKDQDVLAVFCDNVLSIKEEESGRIVLKNGKWLLEDTETE